LDLRPRRVDWCGAAGSGVDRPKRGGSDLPRRIVAYPVGFEVTLDAFTRAVSWGWAFDERVGEGTAASLSARRPSCFATASSSPTGAGRAISAGCSAAPWSRCPRPITRSPTPPRTSASSRGEGTAADASRGGSSGSGRCRPPAPVAFVCEWRGTESPRAGLRSRPLRSALRHRKPWRSGLRPGNNGGCRVGRVVIRAPDEAKKRAGDRGTLPLSETRASAHRESGRSELVARERLVGMPGPGQSPCGQGLSRCCSQIHSPASGRRPMSAPQPTHTHEPVGVIVQWR
jgi:hypothetical protein